MGERIGIYPGTFDPITLGHADIIRRGAKLVDRLAKSEEPGLARIGTQANTAAYLSAAAETSAVKASESLGRVHELVQAIPDTEGLKEAIDLNTRVTAELSIALANIWNMESAQLMGMGEAGVMDAATAADEQKFIKVRASE